MAIPRRDIDASFKNFPNLISEFKWDVGGNIGPSFFGIDADHVKEIQSQSPEFGPILVRINKHAQHIELVLNHIPNPLASIESQVPTNVFTELKKEIDEIHQSIGSRVEEIENREVLVGDEVVSIDGQVKVLIDRINTINRDEVALGLAPSADIVDLQNQVSALQARKTDLLKELSLLSEEKNVLAIFFSNFYDPQTAQRAINVIRVNRHRRDAARSRQDARDAIANQHIIDKEAKKSHEEWFPEIFWNISW